MTNPLMKAVSGSSTLKLASCAFLAGLRTLATTVVCAYRSDTSDITSISVSLIGGLDSSVVMSSTDGVGVAVWVTQKKIEGISKLL